MPAFLTYAPEFPGSVAEQQHILEPLPPAPITSRSTVPFAGAIQQ